jgi:predicted phage baseplate assembly protein
MTLAPLQLDDLTWDDMVAAIRRRIPAESQGNWTLHAPADPGITLLELFAFLTEQRMYWLNQVPDAFVVAVLRLLDLDAPRPAVPAATVLQIVADLDPPKVFTVPAGTGFTRDPRGEVVFTVDDGDDVTVLPVRSLAVYSEGRDRTADLAAGRQVDLLPAGGDSGEAQITLDLARGVTGGYLSLLVDLAMPGTPAAWSPDHAGDVPPPAALTWAYDDDHGGWTEFSAAEVTDGTQGLRRSGIVRLTVPPTWNSGAGLRTLRLSASQATFAAPPRLHQLQVNVAAARHSQDFSHGTQDKSDDLDRQVSDWLPLPAQHLDLPGTQGRLLTASLKLRERDGQEHDWTAVSDFVFCGPQDRVFVIDRAAGSLRFGDGRTGRIPVPDPCEPGNALTLVTWTLGGGTAGNGGTTANWRGTGDAAAVAAVNLVPAADGTEAETIAQARARAGAAPYEVHRAVTVADHETIALNAPGVAVARAHAAVGDHPAFPCALVPGAVSVYVVPVAPRGDPDWDQPDFVAAPQPDPELLSYVRAALDTARLLGEELFVRKPTYRKVRLQVEITGTPREPGAVRGRVTKGVRRYLDPLTGGDQQDGWPFGAPVRPSALLRVAQQAAGHDGDVSRVAIALDAGTAWENCRDVAIRPHELVTLAEPADVTVLFSPGSRTGPAGGLS